jgi:Ser/Thr protein kinase RdoA (MazF antagonist)
MAGVSTRVEAFPATPTKWATTYRIHVAGSAPDRVARVLNPRLSAPESIRAEFELARELGAVSIGPAILYADHRTGLAIMEHAPGGHLKGSATARHVEWTANLLKRLHGLPNTGRPRLQDSKISESLAAARQLFDAHPSLDIYAEALGRYAEADQFLKETTPVEKLCHNDLNPTNILLGESRAWLIDFDHMGLGDASFDLATVILSLRLRPAAENHFLRHYFRRPPTVNESRRIESTKSTVLLRYALMTLALLPMSFDFSKVEVREKELSPPFVFRRDESESHEAAVYRLSRAFLAGGLNR